GSLAAKVLHRPRYRYRAVERYGIDTCRLEIFQIALLRGTAREADNFRMGCSFANMFHYITRWRDDVLTKHRCVQTSGPAVEQLHHGSACLNLCTKMGGDTLRDYPQKFTETFLVAIGPQFCRGLI